MIFTILILACIFNPGLFHVGQTRLDRPGYENVKDSCLQFVLSSKVQTAKMFADKQAGKTGRKNRQEKQAGGQKAITRHCKLAHQTKSQNHLISPRPPYKITFEKQ